MIRGFSSSFSSEFLCHILLANLRIFVFTTMVSFSTDDDDVDFENSSLGMWKNSYIDNLDWKCNSRSTQTIDTGPSRDHTSGSGEEYMLNQSNYSIDIY